MRWCVASVLVFSQASRAATSRTQGQLCGTAGYSHYRPKGIVHHEPLCGAGPCDGQSVAWHLPPEGGGVLGRNLAAARIALPRSSRKPPISRACH